MRKMVAHTQKGRRRSLVFRVTVHEVEEGEEEEASPDHFVSAPDAFSTCASASRLYVWLISNM